MLKDEPKKILTLFADLLGSYGQYAYSDDNTFEIQFTRWREMYPTNIIEELGNDEKRFHLYQEIAKRGELFTFLFNALWEDSELGSVTYDPNIAEAITNEFERTLHVLEKDLIRRGNTQKLHRGLIWYQRAMIHLAKNRGMLSFNAINMSIEEDRKTYGSSFRTGLAFTLKQSLVTHLYNMINDIDDHTKQTVKQNIFKDMSRNTEAIENKSDTNLMQHLELVISYSYGVGYNRDLSVPDPEENLRIENEFRMLYTAVEQFLRNLTESLPSFKLLQSHNPNFGWQSLGGLNPRVDLTSPISKAIDRSMRDGIISNTILNDLYRGHTPIRDLDDILFPSREKAEIQLGALQDNLRLGLASFNAFYSFKILNRARNLFLHNTLPMKTHLTLNERRKLLRNNFLFINMYLERIATSITNRDEDW